MSRDTAIPDQENATLHVTVVMLWPCSRSNAAIAMVVGSFSVVQYASAVNMPVELNLVCLN